MFKVVFDTVVLVRSLINPYGRWGDLVFRNHGKYELYVSQEVVEEYLEVLHRPELVEKFQSLEDISLKKIIAYLGKAPSVVIHNIPRVSRDPKDNIFLATAEESGADYLISEDNDLLTLQEFKGIKIITTLQFLRILDGGSN